MNLALQKMKCLKQVVILCSSGVDSISASHFYFKKIKDRYGFHGIRHFNHNLRDQNNLMQISFEKFAEEQNIPRITYPYSNLLEITDNSEDGLRQARLSFIKEYMDDSIIITGHHLDDATESYMMNVLRGKEGYLPIPFITEVGSNLIVHPFIFTKKIDFIQYAERNDLLKYVVEDETNSITKGSRRNFIRNEVLPLIRREKMGLDTIVKKKMNERLMIDIVKM